MSNKKILKISDYVIAKRKESGLSARKFAKKYGVSDNIIGRYEKGEVDNPSNLEAYNFCKYFDLSAEELLTKFDLSNKTDQEIEEMRNYLAVRLEELRSTEINFPDYLLADLNKYFHLYATRFCTKETSGTNFNVPTDAMFNNQDYKDISMTYFPARVLERNVLDSYKDLCDAIAYAIAIDQPLKNKKKAIVENFLFVVSSKTVFKELTNYFEIPKNGKNVCVVYCEYRTLPLYCVISGTDFINIKKYKY